MTSELAASDRIRAQVIRDQPVEAARLWPWMVAALALMSPLVFFRLGDRPLWSPEGTWAEVAREMQLSGNYFWPTLNGTVYFDKPLLTYWLVLAASHLSGALNEFAVRLPSAISALLCIALVMLLAWKLYGVGTAVLASLIMATSYRFVFFSHEGEADLETLAGITAALTLFLYKKEKPNRWWVVGLWLIMALTSLAKGLQGFALPVLIIGSYSLLADGWAACRERILGGTLKEKFHWLRAKESWFFSWTTLPAAGTAMLIYFSPFVVSYIVMHSNEGLYQVWRENVVRYIEPFDHRNPPFLFYAYAIFELAAPWSSFLPAALVQAYAKPGDRSDRFALVYFWTIFIFFTLCGSKRDYYLLPMLPAAALLIARLFVTAIQDMDRRARRLMYLGYVWSVLAVVVGGVVVALPPELRPGMLRVLPVLPHRALFIFLWVLALGAILYAVLKPRAERMALSIFSMAYLCFFFVFALVFPETEFLNKMKHFSQGVLREVHGDLSRLILSKEITSKELLFYLASPKPILVTSRSVDLTRLLEPRAQHWVLCREREHFTLPVRGSVVLREQVFPWEGPDRLGNRYVLVRLVTSE